MINQRKGEPIVTTHAAKRMVTFLNGTPAQCTINRHCRTLVFAFPGSDLVAGNSGAHHIICRHGGMKATILSDLLGYFENDKTDSIHFAIDVALRTNVATTHRELVTQRNRPQTEPLFLVIEEDVDLPPTVLDGGECYRVDEHVEGDAMIVGGRDGERMLMAFRTVDGSWPDYEPDLHILNVVLTAVKMEQNTTGYIHQKCSGACFVNTEGEAVRYGADPILQPVQLDTISAIDTSALNKKVDSLRTIIGTVTSESHGITTEVFDSVVREKTHDDAYLRLWYLRLWEAIADKRVKRHLGYKQLENCSDVVAGNRTPKELKRYRNDIAHWRTGKIDYSYVNDLEKTTLELLRGEYAKVRHGRSERKGRGDGPQRNN